MFLIDLLIYSLFSLAVAFSPNVIWVIIFRFFAGIGLGAAPPLTDVYLSEMLPHRVRGRYTAWAYTIGLLGVPVAGLLSKVLVSTAFLIVGWRWLLVVGALGALVVWFLRRGLPESPRWLEIRKKTVAAESAISAIEHASMRELHLTELPPPTLVVVEPPKRTTLTESFRGIYAKRTVMLLIFQFFQAVGFYGFGSLAPLILVAKGFSVVNTLAYTAPIALGYPLGSLLSVPIVEHMERKWLIVATALFMALFGLVFGFATWVPLILTSGFLLTVVSQVFSNGYHIYQAEGHSHTYARHSGGNGLQLEPSFQWHPALCGASPAAKLWSHCSLHRVRHHHGHRESGCGRPGSQDDRPVSGKNCALKGPFVGIRRNNR